MTDSVCFSCGRPIAGRSDLGHLCPSCLLQTALGRASVPYRVVSPLGAGTRGPVFLAETTGAGRRLVTVKEVAIAASDAEALERLDRMLDRIAALRHDALLPFLDGAVSDAGRLRLVADYVAGSAIHVYLRREHPPMPARATLLGDACRAIGFAHRHGFTHGHLGPSDVLVSVRGGAMRARVRDVGLPELLGLAPDPGRDLLALADLVELVGAGADPIPAGVAEALRPLPSAGADTAVTAETAARALDELAGAIPGAGG